jgi:hypothetical protein
MLFGTREYVLVMFVAMLAVVCGCRSRKSDALASPGHDVVSPSGKLKLAVAEEDSPGGRMLRFEIRDATAPGQVLYRCPDAFSARHRTFFLWGPGDAVWVYSGDVGTYVWLERQRSRWEKELYTTTSGATVPEELKRLKPKLFK